MKLISCGNCGVVLDADKIEAPEIWDDAGAVISAVAYWDGDRFLAKLPCPCCKTMINESGEVTP